MNKEFAEFAEYLVRKYPDWKSKAKATDAANFNWLWSHFTDTGSRRNIMEHLAAGKLNSIYQLGRKVIANENAQKAARASARAAAEWRRTHSGASTIMGDSARQSFQEQLNRLSGK